MPVLREPSPMIAARAAEPVECPPVRSLPLAPGVAPRFTLVQRLKAHASIARPDHWFKNVFMALGVLLAFFYHPELLTGAVVASIALALVATCLIASSNYTINEILDAPRDRSHPSKRGRPIPSGRLWLPA